MDLFGQYAVISDGHFPGFCSLTPHDCYSASSKTVDSNVLSYHLSEVSLALFTTFCSLLGQLLAEYHYSLRNCTNSHFNVLLVILLSILIIC